MNLDDLLHRTFGTSDLSAITPAALEAGAERLTVDLGPGVTLVPNEAGVTGGIRLWDLNEDKC